ncbi:SIMPL domain-containing protein [Brucepastera parasyntrophica]|uniref:SIMPL domain-containing protein n=1 Tax=Brucepastera parasyntrophica TaxID=2880008 RepID=UPI00210BB2ED|nr:SIMPL domain-containing protein [Brucepastera parasyntrophica]ULQ60872.1 SIMPL domain-containing protein [Brucepastera parasyntrophica]
MKGKAYYITASILAAGLMITGLVLAMGIASIRSDERTVSVRGLSEREFPADMAVWPLTFSVGGNSLPAIRQDIIKKIDIITDYLEKHGLSSEEFTVKEPSITDTSTDPYMNRNEQTWTYIAKNVVLVRSSNIEAVTRALADSLQLLDAGIALARSYDSQVQYLFTALNDVKPDMIAEATQNARKAAEQFARDSGSKVGKIKWASQGLFSIDDAAPGLPEKKTVRVVTTIEYILAD